MLFGEFLVQKGLMSAPVVLGMLIEQIRNQPSVAEIIFTEKLLTEMQQLEVLRVQSRTGWDYQQACVDRGYWSDTIATVVIQKSAQARTPIGQLIVKSGLMPFGELTRALDEFVGSCETDGATANVSLTSPPRVPPIGGAIGSADSKAISASNQVSQPLSTEERQFAMVDATLLAEYFEVLPENRLADIKLITRSWPEKSSQGQAELVAMEVRALSKELTAIQAAARFVRAELTEALAAIGSMMAMSVGKDIAFITEKAPEIGDAIMGIYNVTWQIRSLLAGNRSERLMWVNDEHRKSYEEALAKARAINDLACV